MNLPNVIVFDLDFTLWDCGGVWIDCSSPPFSIVNNKIVDSRGAHMRLYDDVRDILRHCREQGFELALASRTTAPDWAEDLLSLLQIDHYFPIREIFPGSKISHFKNIQQQVGCEFSDMLFFDDEMRNIDEVGALGVKGIYVENGLNAERKVHA